MNKHRSTIALTFFLALLATAGQAADVNVGKNQSAVCQGCHGSEGYSAGPMFPNLAGQSRIYLETQLKKFKAGERQSPTMKSVAEELSDEEVQNLAAHFSSLPSKSSGGDATLAKVGKDKAAMCMGCHGEKLQGNGQFPKLAGQRPQYLVKQLNDFKSGVRKAGHMNAVAQNLTEDDIKALAAYLGSL
jgi:cytochrome c553